MSRQTGVARVIEAIRGLSGLLQDEQFEGYYGAVLAKGRVNAPTAHEAWADYRSSIHVALEAR